MKHIHHIIPRHMGGTDHPNNLVELTVEEHAAAHKLLFEKYNKDEDRIAWLSLCGQITHKEAVREGKKLGRAKTNEILKEKYGPDWRSIVAKMGSLNAHTPAAKEKAIATKIKNGTFGKVSQMQTESALSKKANTFKKIQHQQGSRNSQYGTMWITNGTQNKKIHKEETMPEGWYKGRI